MRKPLLLCLLAISLAEFMSAQSIGFQTQYSHTGLSSSLSFSKNFRPNTAYHVGLKFLINQPVRDNAGFAYRHRFYAANTGQHFGLSLGIERSFHPQNSAVRPFAFYQLLVTRSQIRRLDQYITPMTVYNPNPDTVYYLESYYTILPSITTAFENIIGVGFSVQLWKQLDLRLAAGGSVVAYLHGSGNGSSGKRYYTGYEFGDYYSAGLIYRLAG